MSKQRAPEEPHIEDHGRVVGGNVKKDPEHWKTGDEPMTGAQLSYLQTLSEEVGEEVDQHLTKADASKRIDELRQKAGR